MFAAELDRRLVVASEVLADRERRLDERGAVAESIGASPSSSNETA